MRTKIVCGFPGVGKSWLLVNHRGCSCSDSDSGNFSWQNQAEKIRHPEWPNNYIAHLTEKQGEVEVVFGSTHKEVREALVSTGMHFFLVYPSLNMKQEYIQRYIARGNAPAFVKLLEQNYEDWIKELSEQRGCTHIVLQPGQYLADVLDQVN